MPDDLLTMDDSGSITTHMIYSQYIILFHHFRELLKKATEENIDVIPLKGAHLLTSVYPPAEDRGTIADVDFLVRPRDWHRMLAIMEDYGFSSRVHFKNESKSYEKGYNYILPNGKQMLFEAHQHLFDQGRFPIDTNGIWQRAYASDFDGVPCHRMADEDLFCHVAWHSAIHRFAHHDRTMRDLELILRHWQNRRVRENTQDNKLLQKIEERAKEWRCTKIVWLYLALLQNRIQSEPEMERIATNIAPPLHSRLALKFLIGEGKEPRFAHLHHRLRAAIIWPLVFDSKVQLAKMILHHPRSPF